MTVFAVGSAATGAWFMQSMASDARASRTMAATAIAAGLAAQLRWNATAARDGAYGISIGERVGDCRSGCAPADLAVDDMRRFRHALQERLGPSATGEIRCTRAARDAGPGMPSCPVDCCAIAIRWREREVLTWQVAL